MKILYVEDDPHDADLTVRTLRKIAPDIRLETVSTLREAQARLEGIASDPLDLVLTDMHLRDGDGLTLLQHIRENRLPLAVVLVTGMGDEETAVAALKARADDYVIKHKDYLQRLPIILTSALNHYQADATRRMHPLRVLYAEAESRDIENTRRHLAVHADHIHLDAVHTGPLALAALRTEEGGTRYDVLLMNFQLPGLNALEVLRELRLTQQQDVPVVLLCDEGEEELARQGVKVGASSYLVKSPGYLYQLSWQLEEAHSRADLLRREAALRASEARNRAILNAIPDLMFLQSRDGTYLDYHAKDPGLLLSPPEQFLGKKVTDVMPPELAATFMKAFEQASDKPVLVEYELPMPWGQRFYEASIVSCNGDKVLSIVRDITERKRAEAALKESEEQVRIFVEHTPAAVAMFDREMRYLMTSHRWFRDNNIPEQNIIGRSHYEVVPEVPERWREGHRRCLAGAIERREEDVFLHPDGTFDWVRWEIRPWYAANGEIGGVIMFSETITERKRAEEALRASEDRFAKAFRSNPQSMLLTTLEDCRFIDINESFINMSGYTREELIGRTSLELGVWERPADHDAFLQHLREAGSLFNREMKFRTKSAAIRVLLLSAELVEIEGRPCILIAGADITERKQAERALSFQAHLLNTIEQSVVATDMRGVIIFWNHFAEKLYGWTMEEALGSRVKELLRYEDTDGRAAELWAQLRKGQSWAGEFTLNHRDGSPVEVWVSDSAIYDERGNVVGVLGISYDISERKRAEDALRESEERLRLAQQAAHVGTWEWNVQTGAAVWSEMVWQQLGLEPGSVEPLFGSFVEFIHPEDRQRVLRKVEREVADGDEYDDEFRLVRRDGKVLWVSSKGRLIRSASGRPERMLGVNIDITERKAGEESLKQALDEVRQLKDRLHEENIYLQEEIRVASNFGEIIGGSRTLRRVLHQAEQVAGTDTTVLLLGETGTGKELMAHAVHTLSPRDKHPLVKLNCAALPPSLIESELFGHEKGAFTGASAQRRGRFELADGGTIFLDEIGELPLDLQPKLLRVLEQGEFERVGGSHTLRVNVRVIAATNRDLAEAVSKGTFRSDLFYRLSIFPITVPPLRERREDIPVLVTHFVKQFSVKLGKEIETVPQKAMTALQNYSWPGNIRELRNVIERAVIVTQGSKLQLIDGAEWLSLENGTHLPGAIFDSQTARPGATETLEQSEYNLILRTLKQVYWKVEGPGGAAELLRVHPSTLRTRMKKLGIARPKAQNSSVSF